MKQTEAKQTKDERKFSRFVSGNKRKRKRYYSVAPTSFGEQTRHKLHFEEHFTSEISKIAKNDIAAVIFIF